MIACGYSVHLYCDCRECTNKQWGSPASSEYVGEYWSECAAIARKDGWSISKDRQRCFAPGHKISRSIK